jgi:hypothetical protein
MANCEPEESPTLAEQGNDLLDLPDVVADASADRGCRGHVSSGRMRVIPRFVADCELNPRRSLLADPALCIVPPILSAERRDTW